MAIKSNLKSRISPDKCTFQVITSTSIATTLPTTSTIIITTTTTAIIRCDEEAACGSTGLLTALCYQSGGVLLETSFEYWVSRLSKYQRCLPCCILDVSIHRRMKTCSSMSSASDIRKQRRLYGRCGIDFHP